MDGGEELYDEAEVGLSMAPDKQMRIIDKVAAKPAEPVKKFTPPTDNLPSKVKPTDSANLSVKERLALLQSKNNEPAVNKPFLPKKPPQIGTNNNTVSNFALNRPPIGGKPTNKITSPAAAISAAIANKSPTVNLSDINIRKKSLKCVQKRDSQMSASDETKTVPEETIIVTKEQKKFKTVPFAKKPGKPAKPTSLNNVTLPIVRYTDVETGVEKRIGAGRVNADDDSFKIKSMSEDDEFKEEGSKAPALPISPHPHGAHRTLPARPTESFPPPPPPVVIDPSIEELYGEGEIDKSIDDDGQELYEEFDEIPPPPMPARNHMSPPEVPPPTASPESTRKLSKADKEKEKKEKQKQEKLAREKEKQRIKEMKERDAFMKRYKVTDDEMISSHYVEVINDANGGKMNLAVKAKEKLQLVRKTGCPDNKWIVKNPLTDLVGLVDASNIIDLDSPQSNGVGNPVDAIDEEIYEELA